MARARVRHHFALSVGLFFSRGTRRGVCLAKKEEEEEEGGCPVTLIVRYYAVAWLWLHAVVSSVVNLTDTEEAARCGQQRCAFVRHR
eukprot:5735011-Amphidinium_carterae.1